MKNIIYIMLFSCVLSIFTTSCDNETEMLFDETASQRKTAAVEHYQETLKNSDEGWLFQYFPDKEMQYGGYSYVVKFDENDSVAVWYEGMNDLTAPAVSFYDVISYGGPVLTFNTYNPFMHYFATPSGAEYNAKGGDYEFLLMSSENDVITVQGTKTGNKMRLTKMTEPAEDYIAKVKEIAGFLGGASFNVTVNGEDVSAQEMNRNFTFEYTDNGNDTSIVVPYIVTDTGISFYEPVEIQGQSYQDLVFNEQELSFSSIQGNLSIQLVVAPVNLTSAPWSLDIVGDNTCSDTVFNTFVEIYNANAQVWGEQLAPTVKMGGVRVDLGDIGISFYSYPGPYRSHYNLSFSGVPNQPDYLDIAKVSEGFNWSYYTHLGVFVDVITDNAPYQVEMDDEQNPSTVKLTSVGNADVWFVLTLD
ncbi:DUF4302 domain-containing protein [Sunxiuqinia indica]|uniref:DUF4302 domain-containing protein n=1 Tax=Sunxiuqinia indica TaxID=2692584 RepID=UPI00135CD7C5|nr:DUF4302 domain-containing protein [Sunxiuqinia indica]